MVQIMSFSDEVNSQIAYKILYLWYPLHTRKGILCHKDKHTLPLACFTPFLWCMRNMRGTSDGIYNRLMFHTEECHVSWGLLSNCIWNTRFWVPSQHGKYHDTLQGMLHIAVGVFHTLPLMHKARCKSFWHHLLPQICIKPCHFCMGCLSNCIQNIRFWVPSWHMKWVEILQLEVSITAEVFHNLPLMQMEGGMIFW